ncbi:GAF and ANTAR domain-containing protein [Streptomyces sp. NPDC046831]|uniref:GAF and ANTAR domain-containing protein n=1 Tax=Streptomyces sp. NPDC046831 TaxID=3154805 RepID=UPI0033E66A2E
MTRHFQTRPLGRDGPWREEVAANREERLTRAFVDLADTLDDRFDPLDLFDRLSGYCVGLLAVDAAGAVMTDARGDLRVMASSEEPVAALDLFQAESHEGPSVDCCRTGLPVAGTDLATGTRWPGYARRALAAGYACVHAVPLRIDGRAIGALTLLGRPGTDLPAADLAVAQGLCDISALALAHWPTEPTREHDLLTSLQAAISAKATVELAKGLVGQYAGIPFTEALTLLRRFAEREGRSLTSAARDLAAGRLTLDRLLQQHPEHT